MTTKPQGTPFVKQAALLGFSFLIGRLLGFGYRLPLTGLLGDEGNAWYATGYAVFTIFLILSASALPTAVSKLVSERIARGQYRNAHGMFRTTMTFSTLVGIAMALLMWFLARPIANLLNSPESVYAIRALAPPLAILGTMCTFRGYFLGMKSSLPVALSQTAEQIFNVGFSLWLAFLLFDPERLHRAVAGAAAGTGIGSLAALLVLVGLYALVQRDFKQRMVKDLSAPYENERRQLRLLLLTTFPIILSMGIYALGTPLDIGMSNIRLAASGAFNTEEINILVGQFNGKFLLLTGLPVALAFAISTAVIPEISASSSLNDYRTVRTNINIALRLAMVITIPSAVGLAVLANPILALLFPSHPDGGFLLQWGSISIVFLAINQIMTGSLQGIGKISMPVIAAFFGILVKIPVNHFLIAVPSINIIGAVISTILCYVVASALNIFFLHKTTGILPNFANALIKPLIAAIIMGIACAALHTGLAIILPAAAATLLSLLLGIVIYLTAMLLIKGFNENDLAVLPLPNKVHNWLVG